MHHFNSVYVVVFEEESDGLGDLLFGDVPSDGCAVCAGMAQGGQPFRCSDMKHQRRYRIEEWGAFFERPHPGRVT